MCQLSLLLIVVLSTMTMEIKFTVDSTVSPYPLSLSIDSSMYRYTLKCRTIASTYGRSTSRSIIQVVSHCSVLASKFFHVSTYQTYDPSVAKYTVTMLTRIWREWGSMSSYPYVDSSSWWDRPHGLSLNYELSSKFELTK